MSFAFKIAIVLNSRLSFYVVSLTFRISIKNVLKYLPIWSFFIPITLIPEFYDKSVHIHSGNPTLVMYEVFIIVNILTFTDYS